MCYLSALYLYRVGWTTAIHFCSARLTCLLRKVQSVQNAAARLVTGAKRRDHITPVLQQLHWLPVLRRIEFKIACLVHQSLSGRTLTYLAADIHQAVDHGRHNLHSASYHRSTTLSMTGVFLSLYLVCGTVCLLTYDLRSNGTFR